MNSTCYGGKMKIRINITVVLIFLTAYTFYGCGGNPIEGNTPLNSGSKTLMSFSIVSPPSAGIIDEPSKTVSITVPHGTDVTDLVASFSTTGERTTIGGVDQISSTTPNDFTNPVIYTVHAQDGSSADYTVTVTVVTPADPSAADTLPAPSGTDRWYSFQNDYFGLALVGTTFTFDEDSFEESIYYWDGGSWKICMAFKGSLTNISGSEYDAKLEQMYFSGDSGSTWYSAGTEEFDGGLSHIWSTKGDTARVSLAVSGDTLIYKRDQTGDNLFGSKYDFSKNYNKTAYTALSGHGKYPLLVWASWSFHGNGNRASSSGQPDSILGEILDNSPSSHIQSIKGIAKDQNGNSYGPFTYTWDPGEKEYNIEYSFTDPAHGGIWWLAELKIIYKNGASAIYTAADPWSQYTVTYVTDTGYVSPSPVTAWDLTAAQDYMPPDTAGSGRTFYYVRTLPNASCDLAADYSDYTDSTVYIYSADDTTKWLAKNDDFDNDFSGVYAALKYPFESGKTYYVKVEDLNHNTRPYSIVLQSGYDVDESTGTVVIADDDAYEDDDTPATAKDLPLNTVQDRVSASGDEDWMKLVFDVSSTYDINGTWDIYLNDEATSSGYLSILDTDNVLSGFYHSNSDDIDYNMTGTVSGSVLNCLIDFGGGSSYQVEVNLDTAIDEDDNTVFYFTGRITNTGTPILGVKR